MHSICDALGLKRGQQAAITNGRLITLPDGTFLSTGEVELMQYVAYRLQPGMAVRQSLRDAQDNHRTSFQSSEGMNYCQECTAWSAPQPSQPFGIFCEEKSWSLLLFSAAWSEVYYLIKHALFR